MAGAWHRTGPEVLLLAVAVGAVQLRPADEPRDRLGGHHPVHLVERLDEVEDDLPRAVELLVVELDPRVQALGCHRLATDLLVERRVLAVVVRVRHELRGPRRRPVRIDSDDADLSFHRPTY